MILPPFRILSASENQHGTEALEAEINHEQLFEARKQFRKGNGPKKTRTIVAHQDRLGDLTRLRSRSRYLPLGSEFLQPVRISTGEACIRFSRCELSIIESCPITLLTLQNRRTEE